MSLCLHAPTANVVTARPIDTRWARANVLHFFANREDAAILKAYNTRAADYLTGNAIVGAYGPIAWPSLLAAISAVRQDRFTRRAVFTFTDFSRPPNRNLPACISFGQLLVMDRLLTMHVYQRSLNAWSVLPYDLVLLTNLLVTAAGRLGIEPGPFHWTVGSLHAASTDLPKYTDCDWSKPAESLVLPDLSSDEAWKELHQC